MTNEKDQREEDYDRPILEVRVVIPYRIRNDGSIYTLGNVSPRSFFSAGFPHVRMNEDSAKSLATRFLKYRGIEKTEIKSVKMKIFDQDQVVPSGDSFNQLEVIAEVLE